MDLLSGILPDETGVQISTNLRNDERKRTDLSPRKNDSSKRKV